MVHTRRDDCRGCGSAGVVRFLELGPQPLANALPASPDDFAAEASYPLDVFFCPDCSLVQVMDVIDPEVLFGHYLYVTGTSTSMASHWDAYAAAVVDEHGLDADDLVVEIACNDGSLLERFGARGTRMLGIEPARNIAALARERGLEIVNRFFDAACAEEVAAEHGGAAAVIANNVLAHVDDTRGFLEGMAHLAGRDGVVVVEAPYLGEFLDRLEYDTVYHEHLCYFSVRALMHLYASAGLSIVRIDDQPVHGGTLRIHARSRDVVPEHDASVERRAVEEADRGLHDAASYHAFADRVRANREALLGLLRGLRDDGKRLAAYGAPAKGHTLLNYCGIGPELVEFTVDRNPLKVDRFTPGTHLPIRTVETLRAERPDHVLILPWNLADEIMEQEKDYRAAGGRFIIPIPEPRIV